MAIPIFNVEGCEKRWLSSKLRKYYVLKLGGSLNREFRGLLLDSNAGFPFCRCQSVTGFGI